MPCCGTSTTGVKGLAMVRLRPTKNSTDSACTLMTQGRSTSRRAVRDTRKAYSDRIHAHSRMLPSSAAHRVTTFTHVGDTLMECSATYRTVKSSFKIAYSSVPIASETKKKLAHSAQRVLCSSRESPRRPASRPLINAYSVNAKANSSASVPAAPSGLKPSPRNSVMPTG